MVDDSSTAVYIFLNLPGLIDAGCKYYFFSEGGESDSHPTLGGLRTNSNTYMLHLLDLERFKNIYRTNICRSYSF